MTRTKHHSPHYEHNGKGNFDEAYHLEMVSDLERVRLFKKGIDKLVNEDTVFCELGCGTGIFSIYAAQRAKKVYAVELDENIHRVAEQNIDQSGLSEKIVLEYGDASSIQLPEKVDVVFCEMLSIWMIEEPQVLIMNHARENLLKPGGITIPEKVINLAELCNVDYVFGDVEIKSSIAQFTGIKHPRVMTESRVFNVISFDKINPPEISKSIEFNLLTPGTINSMRLSSIVKIADGVNFHSTDSLMPLTIVPLGNELYAGEGQKVKLTANYRHRESIEDAAFGIE
jgi:predicted RNA methylase